MKNDDITNTDIQNDGAHSYLTVESKSTTTQQT